MKGVLTALASLSWLVAVSTVALAQDNIVAYAEQDVPTINSVEVYQSTVGTNLDTTPAETELAQAADLDLNQFSTSISLTDEQVANAPSNPIIEDFSFSRPDQASEFVFVVLD
jgi:hypothetical protein